MNTLEFLKENSPQVSVGILTADLMSLRKELGLLNGTDVKLLHFDVMDGCFAPMLTMGPLFIKAVETPLLKDVHLMIREPLDYIGDYIAAGADLLTVHAESCLHVHRVLQAIGEFKNANDPGRGIVRGVALNPGTPLATLDPLLEVADMVVLLAVNPGWGGQSFIPSTTGRISAVKKMIADTGRDILLCVDGGIKKENMAAVGGTGADIVVTGSAVFDGAAPTGNARFMVQALDSGRR